MMIAMGISRRLTSVIALIVIGIVFAACSNSGTIATSTPGSTIEDASPVATENASVEATPELPDWVQARLDSGDADGDGTLDELERYVVATGGGGVAHRTSCEDTARLNSIWPEGMKLEVVASSTNECGDWTLVTDGEITSWVLDKYLTEKGPVATAATGGSGGGGGGGGSAGWVQVLQYGQGLWKVPLSQLRVAPASETWCEFDSWHDPAGGDYVVSLVDGTPFVNPDPRGCGFGAVHSVVILWVPA